MISYRFVAGFAVLPRVMLCCQDFLLFAVHFVNSLLRVSVVVVPRVPLLCREACVLLFCREIWFCSYSPSTVTMAMYSREQSCWLGYELDEF